MPFQFRHCWTFDKNVLPNLHLEALLHHLELNCLEGVNDHLQQEGQEEKREKVSLHCSLPTSFITNIVLCYVSEENRWNFVHSRTGSEEQHLTARWETAEDAEIFVEVFFHTMLAVTQKGRGQTGTSPDLCMHIVKSRCTLHSGTEHAVNKFDFIQRGKTVGQSYR